MVPVRSLVRLRRGQAMAEYSIINFLLIIALLFVGGCPITGMDSTAGGGKNIIELFLNAYQVYYDSFYFVLNLPYP